MQLVGRYIQGVPHWRLAIWLIGVVLLYVGGGWPPAGLGVAGLVLVLVAVLRWPWGVDAYRWRCASAASKAARGIEAATKRSCEQQSQSLRELLQISVPDRLAEESQELISLVESAEAMQRDRSTPLPERSAALVSLRDRIEQICADITSRADTVDERSYGNALSAMVAANERAIQKKVDESLGILANLLAFLEGLRPPRRFRAEHDSMCQAFREEFVALSDFYTVSRGSDTQAVRTAATVYQNAAQACYKRLQDSGIRTAAELPRRAT